MQIIYLRGLVPETSAIPMDSLEMGKSTAPGFMAGRSFYVLGALLGWDFSYQCHSWRKSNQQPGHCSGAQLSRLMDKILGISMTLVHLGNNDSAPQNCSSHGVRLLGHAKAVPCVSHTMTKPWAITRTVLAVPRYKNNSLAPPQSQEPTRPSTQNGKFKTKLLKKKENWGI